MAYGLKHRLSKFAGVGVALVMVLAGTAPWAEAAGPDNFSTPGVLSLNESRIDDNVNATVENGEYGTTQSLQKNPCLGPSNYVGATVWYKVVAPTTPAWLLAGTISDSTTFDTVLTLFSGSDVSNLQILKCSDDSAATSHSSLEYEMTPGQTYYLQLGGCQLDSSSAPATGTYKLQVSYSLGGNCTDGPNAYATACTYGFSDRVSFTGIHAEWPSVPLNITRDGAYSLDGWVLQAIWLYDRYGDADQSWLEMGDTAGGHTMIGHENEWARMWYWVNGDALGPGTYSVNFIQYSANDALIRGYAIQKESSGWQINLKDENGNWSTKATVTWKDPSTMLKQVAGTGMEIGPSVVNDNTNTKDANIVVQNFQDQHMLLRDPALVWNGWPAATYTQVSPQCDYVTFLPREPFCLNGSWLQPTVTDNWQNNKP